MARVNIRQVDIRGGFRSFTEPVTLKLPERGLVLLKGINRDTGGTSAAGKSTVLHAINLGFECCPFPSTTHQSWFSQEPYEITYHLDTQDGPATLVRGPKPSLKVGSEKKVTSATGVTARLRALTGYDDPKMLAALTYREQREHGLFLHKTDGEKKEFLTALLGLDRYEAEQEAAQKKVSSLEDGAKMLEAAIKTAKDNLDACPQPVEPELADEATPKARRDQIDAEVSDLLMRERELAELIVQAKRAEQEEATAATATLSHEVRQIEATIAGLRRKISDFTTDDSEVKKAEATLAECVERLRVAQEADRQRERAVDRRRMDLRQERRDLDGRLGNFLLTRKAQEALQREIDQLRDQTCPTCERPWEEAAGGLGERLQRLAAMEAELAEEPAVRERASQIPDEIAACIFEPNPIIPKLEGALEKLRQKVATEREKVKNAVQLHTAEVNVDLSREVAALERARVQVREAADKVLLNPNGKSARLKAEAAEISMKLPGLRSNSEAAQREWQQTVRANQQAQALYDTQKRNYEAYFLAWNRATAAAAASLQEYNEARDWLACIKGYIGSIFDEVLADISHETNAILAQLPNTAHCLLHWRSETETQAKKTVKKIVPVVSIRGIEAPYKSGCSGGMISVIELACDLAVAKVVQRRTGNIPGWLILDESFEGLGTVEKEACMAMLQEYAQDRLIIIVDHASEFKEMFSQVITVEYKDGISRLV